MAMTMTFHLNSRDPGLIFIVILSTDLAYVLEQQSVTISCA